MAGAGFFGVQIPVIMRIASGDQRDSLFDRNAAIFDLGNFIRIIGQQTDFAFAEQFQHRYKHIRLAMLIDI